jgi:cytidylate kinase
VNATGRARRSPVRVVAIDGPAGAGKSTLARALAEHLRLERLDTGAMYRSVAWAALDRGIDPADTEAVATLARGLHIEVGEDAVVVDGADATAGIRTAAVDAAVSAVAANPAVRQELVGRQRAWVAARGGGVVEGRDIGTVVLPDADLKVYLTAHVEERAARRAAERGEADPGEVERSLARRDRLDSTRAASPLPAPDEAPEDAVVVDSTGKPVRAVLEEVLTCL